MFSGLGPVGGNLAPHLRDVLLHRLLRRHAWGVVLRVSMCVIFGWGRGEKGEERGVIRLMTVSPRSHPPSHQQPRVGARSTPPVKLQPRLRTLLGLPGRVLAPPREVENAGPGYVTHKMAWG